MAIQRNLSFKTGIICIHIERKSFKNIFRKKIAKLLYSRIAKIHSQSAPERREVSALKSLKMASTDFNSVHALRSGFSRSNGISMAVFVALESFYVEDPGDYSDGRFVRNFRFLRRSFRSHFRICWVRSSFRLMFRSRAVLLVCGL